MKISDVVLKYRSELNNLYSEGELEQVIFLVLEHVKGFSKIDMVLKKDEVVSQNEQEQLDRILSQLMKSKPIQYVLGYAWFYGTKFKVNESVLIPRQETEELVEWIIQESRIKNQESGLAIIDICTGSGCIAVSLKRNLPGTEVYALDISEKALEVAKENATINQTPVQFIQEDILFPISGSPILPFDLIVSNPPYVLESEKIKMQKKELDYEPHLSLFVNDNDPLLFYKKIADFALVNLKPKGRLYFEINEKKGKEVVELLIGKGFSDVILKKDLNGKDRMLRAILETGN